jgi:membrane associated rhomboid family serine protease
MIIPYQVDVPMRRWPISNLAILAAMVVGFIAFIMAVLGQDVLELRGRGLTDTLPYILRGWSLEGLFGYMWLHRGVLHLVGNGIFLWTFGNAVCAKLGNIWYPAVYIGLGMAAGVIHLIFDGSPTIGASGAINGIVGMYIVLYPMNSLSCVYFLFFRFGRFSLSGFWMILLWLVFDILGALARGGHVAYFAHVGGFAAGFALAFFAVWRGWIEMEPDEKSLVQILLKQPRPDRLTASHVSPSAPRSRRFAPEMPHPAPAPDNSAGL